MTAQPTLLDAILSGVALPEQYLGLGILGLVIAFGAWQHLKDTKDDARGRK